MAATADITINNFAAVAKVFTPSVAVQNGFDYRETSTPAAAPLVLRITHQIAAPSSQSNTKAGVRFTKAAMNSASAIRTGYIDLVVSVPKDGLTSTDISDLGAFVRNFLTDANLAKLIIGGY